MNFLRKTRDMLFQSYDQRLISEDELIVLLEENTTRNSQSSFDRMFDSECKAKIRSVSVQPIWYISVTESK